MVTVQPKLAKKHRKHGRKARPSFHRIGKWCGMKNCGKLLASRRWDDRIQSWVSV